MVNWGEASMLEQEWEVKLPKMSLFGSWVFRLGYPIRVHWLARVSGCYLNGLNLYSLTIMLRWRIGLCLGVMDVGYATLFIIISLTSCIPINAISYETALTHQKGNQNLDDSLISVMGPKSSIQPALKSTWTTRKRISKVNTCFKTFGVLYICFRYELGGVTILISTGDMSKTMPD